MPCAYAVVGSEISNVGIILWPYEWMYVYHAQHLYFDETKLAPTDDTIRLWNVKRQGHTLNLCDGESIHAELSPSSIIHVTVVFVSYDCTSATLPR